MMMMMMLIDDVVFFFFVFFLGNGDDVQEGRDAVWEMLEIVAQKVDKVMVISHATEDITDNLAGNVVVTKVGLEGTRFSLRPQ
jgi:hypothetical protein